MEQQRVLLQPPKYSLDYPVFYEYAKLVQLGEMSIEDVPVMFREDAQTLLNDSSLILDYVRAVKWEEIKAQRDYLETHQLEYNGMVLDYNERSALKLEIAVTGATTAISKGLVDENDFAIEWTLKDNTSAKLTYNDLLLIPLAAMDYSDKLHQQGRIYRDKIFNLTDIAEIEAIKWGDV